MASMKYIAGGLLILATVLATSACDWMKSYSDQEYVQKAKEYQNQGKLESAVIEFKNAIQKNPNNPEARRRLGELYVTLGLGADAEKELVRAQALGIDQETLKVPMGQALLLQGLHSRVLEEIQLGPNSSNEDAAKILEIQGRAQFAQRQIEEGCRLFTRSLERDPKYVPGYWGLAHCAAARGKLDETRAQLDKALKLDEKNSATWALLGDLERAVKNLSEAEAAYTNALKYKSNNLEALSGRAVVRIDNNKLDEASQDIDAASKVARGHPIVLQLRGVIQYRQGKFAEAKTSFETVLKAQPDFPSAVLWLGLSNYALGNYAQAAQRFSQYARSFPGATRVRALLAVSKAKLGEGKEAGETLKVLRNVNVKDPQSLALLAQAHLSLGERDLAASYMAKAVEQEPNAANLRVGLAATLSRKGSRAEAIEQLEEAIQLDPDMVTADVLLIQNLMREKQFDKALKAVEALEKKQPKNPTTYNLKGAVYIHKNDLPNARKNFEHALGLDGGSVAAAINLAQLDLLERNPVAARQRFQTVLATDKTNVQAMLGLAGIARATGEETEYVDWLEKAAKAEPKALRPRLLLASYYLEKNEVQKALALARDAQSANPQNIQALDVLGIAQLAGGERENALITFTKLVSLAPKSPDAHYRLATAHAARQDISATKDSLNKALALKPNFLDAEILLASAELGAGRHAEAVKIAQRIQRRHPKSASGWTLEGDAQMAQKQFAPALKAYEKSFGIHKNGVLAVKMHQALSAGGNTKEADARLVQWLKDQPSDVDARAYLAAAYVRTGQTKQAVEQYQLVLQTDPKNILVLNDLAWLYQQEKDPRALATAEQAYQLKPDNPQIMDTLGWILVERGETTRAVELLRKAAEMVPTSPAIHYHWATALAKSGDKAQARRELENLLAKHKSFRERERAEALLKEL